jgi:hypothetical protein
VIPQQNTTTTTSSKLSNYEPIPEKDENTIDNSSFAEIKEVMNKYKQKGVQLHIQEGGLLDSNLNS